MGFLIPQDMFVNIENEEAVYELFEKNSKHLFRNLLILFLFFFLFAFYCLYLLFL